MGDEAIGERPRVSVIVPVRDRADLLRQALRALERQSLRDHEVIVVDDGSRDGSGDVARAAASAGQPVRVVDGGGRGAVAARSLGVEAAKADYLAFTDSDCVPDQGWLAAGVAELDAGADVVQGYTEPIRPPGPMERSLWSIKDDGLFATCNVFYRRGAFLAAGGFDTSAGDRLGFRHGSALRGLGFGEDTLLGWRVRRSGRAAWSADAIVRHEVFRVHPRESLRRAWQAGGFPMLVREVPELSVTLGPDIARRRRQRVPLYGAVLAALARRAKVATALAGVWVVLRWRRLGEVDRSRRRRLRLLPLDLAAELVTAAAMVWGSIRARRPML